MAVPFANLTEPLANLVILSTDAFYRGEGSAFGFADARGKAKAGKANADSLPKKRALQKLIWQLLEWE
jgi:hypothetical protein